MCPSPEASGSAGPVEVSAPAPVVIHSSSAAPGPDPSAAPGAMAAAVHAPVNPVMAAAPAAAPVSAVPRHLDANEWARYMSQIGSVSFLEQTRVGEGTMLDEVRRDLEASIPQIVMDIRGGKRESGFKTWKRKRAFAAKKDVYDSAAAQQWKIDHRTGNQAWRNPPAAPLPAQAHAFSPQEIADLKSMKGCTTDFMKYTDDAAFVRNFDTTYPELLALGGLKTMLEGHVQGDFDAIGDPSLGTFDEIKKTAENYANTLEFYRAKMDLISNPFYAALKKEDTEGLSAADCDQQERIFRAAGRESLADYMNAIRRLKALEAQGIFRDWEGDGIHRIEHADGLKKNHKAHISFFTRELGVKADLPALGIGGRDWMGTYKDNEYLTGDYDRTQVKKDDKGKPVLDSKGNVVREERDSNIWGDKFTLGTSVQAYGKAKLVEGAYDVSHTTKRGGVKLASSGDFSVGEVSAYGKIGASLAIKEGKLTEGYVGAEVGAAAAVAKGSVKASIGKEITTTGITYTLVGAEASASGEFASASADAYAKAGRVTIKDVLTGKSQTIDGLAVGVDAQAALLSGTAKGSIVICGVKIGAAISGQLGGAGVSAGLVVGSGRLGISLGALLGVGGKLDLQIDASFWTQKLANFIAKKVSTKDSPLGSFKKKS